MEGIGTDMNNTMKNKLFAIILVCVLIVAGCSTLITSKMIARGITDDALYNKTLRHIDCFKCFDTHCAYLYFDPRYISFTRAP